MSGLSRKSHECVIKCRQSEGRWSSCNCYRDHYTEENRGRALGGQVYPAKAPGRKKDLNLKFFCLRKKPICLQKERPLHRACFMLGPLFLQEYLGRSSPTFLPTGIQRPLQLSWEKTMLPLQLAAEIVRMGLVSLAGRRQQQWGHQD